MLRATVAAIIKILGQPRSSPPVGVSAVGTIIQPRASHHSIRFALSCKTNPSGSLNTDR
jgi:hypothetical protein